MSDSRTRIGNIPEDEPGAPHSAGNKGNDQRQKHKTKIYESMSKEHKKEYVQTQWPKLEQQNKIILFYLRCKVNIHDSK